MHIETLQKKQTMLILGKSQCHKKMIDSPKMKAETKIQIDNQI